MHTLDDRHFPSESQNILVTFPLLVLYLVRRRKKWIPRVYSKSQRCLSKLKDADALYSPSEPAHPLLGKKHPNTL